MHRAFALLFSALALATTSCGGAGKPPATPGPTSTPGAAASTTPAATLESTPPGASATATPTMPAPTTPTPASAALTPVSHVATSTAAPPATQPPPSVTATAPPPATNPSTATVGVTGSARFFWAPAKVAIAPGGSVTWTWSGDSYHDVVIEGLGYSSGNPVKEGAYTVTFPAAGTYAVSCSVHPDTMRGTVTVE